MSSIALKYALWTQNPSILCLFGFTSVSFPAEDRYFSLMESSTHRVCSIKELKESILQYPKLRQEKAKKIQEMINRDII